MPCGNVTVTGLSLYEIAASEKWRVAQYNRSRRAYGLLRSQKERLSLL
jgi:hypothetical protein